MNTITETNSLPAVCPKCCVILIRKSLAVAGEVCQACIPFWNGDPVPVPILADVIPEVVKHWFKKEGAGRSKIWLFSYGRGSDGYKEIGANSPEIQTKLEKSAHYKAPVVPLDVGILCYTDGTHFMDFAASEIHASLATLSTQPSTETK
ncbi:MAG TPA: hypothetical protein VGH19_06815 [Verrucomicrobiae bacterium]